jgi:hypothetical protein
MTRHYLEWSTPNQAQKESYISEPGEFVDDDEAEKMAEQYATEAFSDVIGGSAEEIEDGLYLLTYTSPYGKEHHEQEFDSLEEADEAAGEMSSEAWADKIWAKASVIDPLSE